MINSICLNIYLESTINIMDKHVILILSLCLFSALSATNLTDENEQTWLSEVFNKLKTPEGVNYNPYNACIWKICSRPLRNRGRYALKVTKYSENSDSDESEALQLKFRF